MSVQSQQPNALRCVLILECKVGEEVELMQARMQHWAEQSHARVDMRPTADVVAVVVVKPSTLRSAHRSAGWGRSAGAAARRTSACAQKVAAAAA